ncbi:hypothetical protein [Nocardiopsis kunsanensis]|uniref:Uncharacterized protein n=1 Tax=Nocardiopsis kunsanensis TaxID=141693 RepID=A0A918X826_9ACTN|nr:hypothetical protein [Nocardiopsis kunsanensis]GHD17530.1 hypothetical protein GCM10007147_06790 [Nocardiopsis kunsanensis]
MIDPTSIGTALTVLAVITVLVIAFGAALLSDMAMRRREDRAATPPEQAAAQPDEPAAQLPGSLQQTEELAAQAPTGAVSSNGRGPSNL